MRYILLTILLLGICFNSTAQTTKGIVLEIGKDGSEVPIFGANIYWETTNVGTISDEDGNFSIESYPAKILNVSYVGYSIDAQEINNGFYKFYLKNSIDLEDVEVKAKVNTTSYSLINPINIETISNKELKKAACCNLSESFSTNATVDVTFNDPVTGAKQIQMLGLDGIYTQITRENMPLIRGLSASYGLHYIPGNWIESIQIIKGSGSVVNGFESLTGQINLEYFKPQSADKLFLNGYVNTEGKFDTNFAYAKKNGKWLSNLFAHISVFDREVDTDKDGFMNMLKEELFTALNRWDLVTDDMHLSIILKGLHEDKFGGQVSNYLDYTIPSLMPRKYQSHIHNDLIELSTKTGFFLNNQPFKNIGLQTSFKRHVQNSNFGDNQYKGLNESIYLNFIAQTYIRHNHHIVKYGLSHYTDHYDESYNNTIYDRLDLTTGLFLEYTYVAKENFTLVAGFRSDYHNETGMYYLPRLNIKYNPSDNTAIRFSAGKAFRMSNIFSENISYFASSRELIVADDLMPEVGWNYGMNVNYCFQLFDREGTINADAYRTTFTNQVIVDIEDQNTLSFYNLDGVSYANTAQLDIAYELLNRLDIKLAYKLNDVFSTFNGEKKSVLFMPKERGLVNLAYATDLDIWKFDFTCNFIGETRLPYHSELQGRVSSDKFTLCNTQVTKTINDFDVYVGCENIFNYTQENPILGSDNPFGENFDASIIWAPIMGRMSYVGVRYSIQ